MEHRYEMICGISAKLRLRLPALGEEALYHFFLSSHAIHGTDLFLFALNPNNITQLCKYTYHTWIVWDWKVKIQPHIWAGAIQSHMFHGQSYF